MRAAALALLPALACGSKSNVPLDAAATDAIDKGVAVPEAGVDLDGQPHTAGAAPDLGADER